jgi:hypothetical protein
MCGKAAVWILTEAEGPEASIPLESIDCVLSLLEVYGKVLDDEDNNQGVSLRRISIH